MGIRMLIFLNFTLSTNINKLYHHHSIGLPKLIPCKWSSKTFPGHNHTLIKQDDISKYKFPHVSPFPPFSHERLREWHVDRWPFQFSGELAEDLQLCPALASSSFHEWSYQNYQDCSRNKTIDINTFVAIKVRELLLNNSMTQIMTWAQFRMTGVDPAMKLPSCNNFEADLGSPRSA